MSHMQMPKATKQTKIPTLINTSTASKFWVPPEFIGILSYVQAQRN